MKENLHGASLWAALAVHDDLWQYLPEGPWGEEGLFRNWLKECEIYSNRLYYAVIDKESGVALGLLALMDYNAEHGTIEVGGIFFSSLTAYESS